MAPPSTPDKFPSEDLSDTLVRIEIGTGEEKRTFEVFNGVLCFYSGYFNTALKGRFADQFVEAQEQVIKLPTEDPKIFGYFCKWIHTRCFFESTISPEIILPFQTLANMWVFGDAHEVPMFQNAVADIICQKMANPPGSLELDDLFYVRENTVESSPLRGLVAQRFYAQSWKELEWDDLNTQSVELVKKPKTWAELIEWRELWENGMCNWHVHEDGVNCHTTTV